MLGHEIQGENELMELPTGTNAAIDLSGNYVTTNTVFNLGPL